MQRFISKDLSTEDLIVDSVLSRSETVLQWPSING